MSRRRHHHSLGMVTVDCTAEVDVDDLIADIDTDDLICVLKSRGAFHAVDGFIEAEELCAACDEILLELNLGRQNHARRLISDLREIAIRARTDEARRTTERFAALERTAGHPQ